MDVGRKRQIEVTLLDKMLLIIRGPYAPILGCVFKLCHLNKNDRGLFPLAGYPMQGTLEGCPALAKNSSSKSMASLMSTGAGEVKMTTFTTGRPCCLSLL